MNNKDLVDIMAAETAHAEATRDEPISATGTRKNQARSRLIAVRFAPEEAEELERQAEQSSTTVSALIRGRALRQSDGPWEHISATIIDAIRPIVQPR